MSIILPQMPYSLIALSLDSPENCKLICKFLFRAHGQFSTLKIGFNSRAQLGCEVC